MLVCFTLYLQSVDLRAVKRKQDLEACDSDLECPDGFACGLDVNKCYQVLKRRENDEDTDECASSPCRNNATCIDLQNNYTCECADGWEGYNCGQDSS